MPEVTVLMTVYNGERYLGDAIESVLSQTFRDFEFVIVDDGSTDRSLEIAASYGDPRIRLLENGRNIGQAAALNYGLRTAAGELVARQDADDLSHLRRLELQVEVMRTDPGLAMLGSQGIVINGSDAPIFALSRPCEHVSIRWFHLFDNPFIHSSVMFRRSLVLDQCGGYDEAFPYAQDYALWSCLIQKYRVRNLLEPLVSYRWHEASRTGSTKDGIPVYQRTEMFRDLMVGLIDRNVVHVLGMPWSRAESELLSRFLLGVEEEAMGPFLELFHRVLESYQNLYPEATKSQDFRRMLARQYETIATRATPAKRSLAFRIYVAAMRHDPALLPWMSWTRFLGLTVVGVANARYLQGLRRAREVA